MKFGKLTLINPSRDEKQRCLFLCDCGKEKMINFYNVKKGDTYSCGCAKKELMASEAKKRFTNKKPANFIDYTGKKIGIVCVLGRIEDKRMHTTTYLLKCDCGTEFKTEISALRRGAYQRCNCGPDNHPLKNTLQKMIDRCENTSEKSYKWYGGKGIKVCEEWKRFPIRFIEWSINNGWNPAKSSNTKNILTIDRIDSSRDYCPENCQWITLSENSKKAMNERWKTLEMLISL